MDRGVVIGASAQALVSTVLQMCTIYILKQPGGRQGRDNVQTTRSLDDHPIREVFFKIDFILFWIL